MCSIISVSSAKQRWDDEKKFKDGVASIKICFIPIIIIIREILRSDVGGCRRANFERENFNCSIKFRIPS